MTETTVVRDNLMNQEDYSPYCGNAKCQHRMLRTKFDGYQFRCRCGWRSSFPSDFIQRYKTKWRLP